MQQTQLSLQCSESDKVKIVYNILNAENENIGCVCILKRPKNCIEISSIYILAKFRHQEYEIGVINKFLSDKSVSKVIISPTKNTVKFWQQYVDSTIEPYSEKVLTKLN